MARQGPGSAPLDGEDLATSGWEDARHWMTIYDDLIRFNLRLLDRVKRELPKLSSAAQDAAADDLAILEDQIAGYYARLDLWFARVRELEGLWLDPEGQIIRHQGREEALTDREFQLLQFLLDHPHRFFTAEQIKDRVWGDPALYPGKVRSHVVRTREILASLELPCDVVSRPSRGYSLIFRTVSDLSGD